jgi:hypothetical protein
MKIRPVEAEFSHADERADRHVELIVAFSIFSNAPKVIFFHVFE